MSDLLGIGYSGLKAYSRALSTIGDNIANAQTPGYARRRLEMMEPVSGSDSIFYRGNVNPAGVEIRGVSRSVDAWLIEDSRLSSGDSARSATTATGSRPG
jgi:flagellar hook-associated protein 1